MRRLYQSIFLGVILTKCIASIISVLASCMKDYDDCF